MGGWAYGSQLREYLYVLFGDEDCQLDHDPALGLRETNKRFPRPDPRHWTPNANDPAHLIYRRKDDDHRIKTYIRGEHGARSDISEMKYRRKVKRNAEKRAGARIVSRKQARRIWPSRPFPKRRKPWSKKSPRR